MIAHSDTKHATETAFITQSDLRLEDKDGKNPEMQEIWEELYESLLTRVMAY